MALKYVFNGITGNFDQIDQVTVANVGSSPNAAGASVSGNVLTLEPADASNPGVISTSSQTIPGAKTFSSAPTFSTMTAGSVLFAGTGGLVSQDNTNLFFDDTNNRLGIGTATPGNPLDIVGTMHISGSILDGSDATGHPSINPDGRTLYGASNVVSVDYGQRTLYDSSSGAQLSWSTSGVNLPQLTASKALAIDGSKNITTYTYVPASPGDIGETSFSAANNQLVAANVTGLSFSTSTVRSFEVTLSVSIVATSSLFEQFKLNGIYNGTSWYMSSSSVGDTSGIVFSITNAGQIQYTSTNVSGFTSDTMKFRAITTSQ